MTKGRILRLVLLLLCLAGMIPASAAFKDIKLDLTGQWLLTDDEFANKSNVEFGFVIADDGAMTRVEATEPTANAVISGKYHNDHGWGGAKLVVPVDGMVKIGVGNCDYAGHTVKVTDAAGNEVAAFATEKTGCWKNSKDDAHATFGYYRGEATTLTITTSSYTPYLSVEAVNEAPSQATVSYTMGSAEAVGTLPAGIKADMGTDYTLPKNFTLYAEGKTLTAWTDGTDTYAPGQTIKLEKDLELSPVFTANTVSLADRTDAVTLTFDFQQKSGAPIVGYQNVTGVWVTQATVNGQVIDVKLDFDTNNGGKIANANWTDWAQMNAGTKLTVPSCKGATIALEAYGAITTTTIDGQSDYTQGTTVSYTIGGTAETIDIIIGDGSYYRTVKVTLPVVSTPGGKTYTDEPAKIIWDFNNESSYETTSTLLPTGAFSIVSVNLGDMQVKGTGTGQAVDENGNAVTFLKIRPSESTNAVEWSVKPAMGLTFTPTKVSSYIQRFGTDAENGVTVTAKLDDGTTVDLGNFTAPRNNKTQSEDKFGGSANYTNQFVITLTEEQQQMLTSADGFHLYATVGVGTTKEGGFSDVRIEGLVNGTIAEIEKYTLAIKADPEEAGTVSVYPKADEYDEGSEVQLTATQNFGYHFLNWTDAEGNVVSEDAKFTYTMNGNAELTAHFQAVKTYELTYSVEGGANLYMVQPTPAPTVVDGKNMYEEGTTVTLTASSNKILTFTNWSDGTSSSEITFNMTEDKTVTANYSAIDFIAGWDFWRPGNNGRKADFAAADNDAATFNLVNEETGESSGWLDKSQEAAGGYEGRPAAVNWKTGTSNGDIGHYYWQTMVNAGAFENIKVAFEMAYNYNSYTTYDVEYSLDGTAWENIGSITLEGAKNWIPAEFDMPATANNAEKLYIRWIADKTSPIEGTSSSNDGNAIANVFIIGSAKQPYDPTAPALVNTVPTEGASNASASGKIVLTFDKRIKAAEGATATLGEQKLEPVVFGKTMTFAYKNLNYDTDYTFTLPAGAVTNLSDIATEQAITINFRTMLKPVVTKALYDFVVPTDGTMEAAIAAADSREDKSKRFRIFVMDGTYKLPQSKTATINCDNGKTYPSPITNINSSNISIIGESRDGAIVTNSITEDKFTDKYGTKSVYEGIGKSDVLQIQGSVSGIYFQDITIKTGLGDKNGRDIAVQDKGTKTIYKNVCLHGYQDTWVSNKESGLYYFEGGRLRGRTDFLCGKGDAYYNAVDLVMCEKGGYLAVPSQSNKYGYVFKDCVIKGEADDIDGNYTLGRPWGNGTPSALYIDTRMEVQPSAIGWNEMGDGWPKRFAEYNSTTKTGTVIDLSSRKKTFSDNHPNNPVLSAEEAAEAADMTNMFGDWQPTLYTEQAQAPANVSIDGTAITWAESNYVLLWAVCKNGKVVAFTTEPSYTADDATATWSVRAANEMGGLSEATIATIGSAISTVNAEGTNAIKTEYFNLQGIRVNESYRGTVIRVQTLENGSKTTTKLNR